MSEQEGGQHIERAREVVEAMKGVFDGDSEPGGIRDARLLRGFFSALESLRAAVEGPRFEVRPTTLNFDGQPVYDDLDDRQRSLAGRLYAAGLREISFLDELLVEDCRRFLDALKRSLDGASTHALPVELWRLNLPHLGFVAVDGEDNSAWTRYDEGLPVDEDTFVDRFLFRVEQALSPRLVRARANFARQTLEGEVSGDSLSMESHFNIIFGRFDAPEQFADAPIPVGEAAGLITPGLVERLAGSLNTQGERADDDRLRALLSEQLSLQPGLSDDRLLLRKAIATARGLESYQPPLVNPEEAAAFYLDALRAALIMGDLVFVTEIYGLIAVSEGPVGIIQAIDKVGEEAAGREEIAALIDPVFQCCERHGLERTREVLTELLLHLDPRRALESIGALYPSIRHEETRLAFQPYLASEGASHLSALRALLEDDDETVMMEGFGILSIIGKEALPLIGPYREDASPLRRDLAKKTWRLAGGEEDEATPVTAGFEALRAPERDARIAALQELPRDDNAYTALEGIIKSPDFIKKDQEEAGLFLTTLARIGGERAFELLNDFVNKKSVFRKRNTRRLSQVATRVMKSLMTRGFDGPDGGE